MSRSAVQLLWFIGFILACAAAPAHAETSAGPEQTHGTLVIVPAVGEVTHANDEAHATLLVEEQDKDKAAAASRVNLKMKQGVEIVKREDPAANLKTRGYYTYPVYADDQGRSNNKLKQPVGWRVGQYLEMTTANLSGLPKTVAAVQQLLALNGLQFGLAPATGKKLDRQRIEAAYQNLTERIASIAKAMGRNVSDAVLDTVDFEGSGAYAQPLLAGAPVMRFAAAQNVPAAVEEPSFEPGETTQQLRVVGKIKFK
jgi:predicted secreted protein